MDFSCLYVGGTNHTWIETKNGFRVTGLVHSLLTLLGNLLANCSTGVYLYWQLLDATAFHGIVIVLLQSLCQWSACLADQ